MQSSILSRVQDPAESVLMIKQVCRVSTNTLPKLVNNEEYLQKVRHEYVVYSRAYRVSFLAKDPF
jgi:hypothetical protein